MVGRFIWPAAIFAAQLTSDTAKRVALRKPHIQMSDLIVNLQKHFKNHAGVTHDFSLAQKISREKFSTDGSVTKISGPNLMGLHC